MEEITEYRVTRHAGSTTVAAGTLLYTTEHKNMAWRFYNLLRPMPGTTLALWTPTGELMASRSGPH